jgi:hypothetical protein
MQTREYPDALIACMASFFAALQCRMLRYSFLYSTNENQIDSRSPLPEAMKEQSSSSVTQHCT